MSDSGDAAAAGKPRAGRRGAGGGATGSAATVEWDGPPRAPGRGHGAGRPEYGRRRPARVVPLGCAGTVGGQGEADQHQESDDEQHAGDPGGRTSPTLTSVSLAISGGESKARVPLAASAIMPLPRFASPRDRAMTSLLAAGANGAPPDDLFAHVASANPFTDNRVSGPAPAAADVADVHRAAFARLTALAREACAARRGLGAVLWGEAGVGKSHVLARLGRWAEAEGHAPFVSLHNLQASPDGLPRLLLRAVVGTLTRGRAAHFSGTPLYRLAASFSHEAFGYEPGIKPSWAAIARAGAGSSIGRAPVVPSLSIAPLMPCCCVSSTRPSPPPRGTTTAPPPWPCVAGGRLPRPGRRRPPAPAAGRIARRAGRPGRQPAGQAGARRFVAPGPRRPAAVRPRLRSGGQPRRRADGGAGPLPRSRCSTPPRTCSSSPPASRRRCCTGARRE